MRRCRSSQWRLIRSSDRLRKGRYYFAPKGTPHYPGVHNLWSRYWVTDDGYEKAALGEWSGAWQYYRGDLPEVLPLPILVGSKDCIRDGEDAGLPDRDPDCGDQGTLLPRTCYDLRDDFERKTNVFNCGFGYLCARIVETVQSDLPTAATMAETLFGPSCTTTQFPTLGTFFPNFLLAQVDRKYFVFFAGTSNASQIIMQVANGIFPPLNQGAYRTIAIWEEAAKKAISRLEATSIADSLRVCLIGHSYGGAIAQVVSAKLKIGTPGRRVELMTFGSPKAGNPELVALNADRKQVPYAAFDDPVPWVPCDAAVAVSFYDILTPVMNALGLLYTRPAKIFVITEEKTIVPTSTFPVDFDYMRTALKLIAAATAPPPFAGHFMRAYASRIREACPFMDDDCDLFPISIDPPPDPDPDPDPTLPSDWYRVTVANLYIAQSTDTFTGDVVLEISEIRFAPRLWGSYALGDVAAINAAVTFPAEPNDAVLTFLKTSTLGGYIGGFDMPLPNGWWHGCVLEMGELALRGYTTVATFDTVTIEPIPPPSP